jgi:hypothetical protein
MATHQVSDASLEFGHLGIEPAQLVDSSARQFSPHRAVSAREGFCDPKQPLELSPAQRRW